MAERTLPTARMAWAELTTNFQSVAKLHLRDLFDKTKAPGRGTRMTAEAVGIYLDYSKNRVTGDTLKLLFALANECDLKGRISAMFSGEEINITEGRAVLHTALRAPRETVITVDGKNVVPDVHAVLYAMGNFSDRV